MTRLEVACPSPDCKADMPVAGDLPAGVYRCLCWACEVLLSWDDGKPRLTLQPKAGAG